jgi:chromosome segregation ATPase
MTTNKSTKEGVAITEQFFGQVSDSIQLVFDLTSRIDERVKILIERQKEIDDQIEKLLEMQHQTLHRLVALESKVATIDDPQKELTELRNKIHALEMKAENFQMRIGYHDSRWIQIFDAVWKILLMIIAGYILYKLGLQAPPS